MTRLAQQEPAAVADVERALLPLRATVEFQKAAHRGTGSSAQVAYGSSADYRSHHSDLWVFLVKR